MQFKLVKVEDTTEYYIVKDKRFIYHFKAKDSKSAKKVLNGFEAGYKEGTDHIPNLDKLASKYGYDSISRIMKLILDEDVSNLRDPVKYVIDKLVKVLDLPQYECPYSKTFKKWVGFNEVDS